MMLKQTKKKEDDDDGAVSQPPAKKVKAGDPSTLLIYTDGSSLGNGRAGSTAGVGVYFGKNDGRCARASNELRGAP